LLSSNPLNIQTAAVTVPQHFDGLSSQGAAPPDVQIAVGPNHIMEMVNIEGLLLDKKGGILADFDPHELFNQPLSHSLFDPKIYYDSISKVWWLVIDDHDCSNAAGVLVPCVHLLVEPSDNPIGQGLLYDVQFNDCPDYPQLGFSDNIVAVSGYVFSSSSADSCEFDKAQGAQYFLLNKNDLIHNNSPLRQFASDLDKSGALIHPVPSMSSTTTSYLAKVSDGYNTVKLLSFDLTADQAKKSTFQSPDSGNIGAAVPSGLNLAQSQFPFVTGDLVSEEWQNKKYKGNDVNAPDVAEVILNCEDPDNNCVNNLFSGVGIKDVGVIATGYIFCPKGPGIDPCDYGFTRDIEYSNGKLKAKFVDLTGDLIQLDLTYDGTSLKASIRAGVGCDQNGSNCQGTASSGNTPINLELLDRSSPSKLTVTTKVINDNGGTLKPSDFKVFLFNHVCDIHGSNCEQPLTRDQLKSGNENGELYILFFDPSHDPPLQTTEYYVNIEAKVNPNGCHGRPSISGLPDDIKCQRYDGFRDYDISFSADCAKKNAVTSENYNCTITLNDKNNIKEIEVGPIGQTQIPPLATQPTGRGIETADNRIRSSAWSNGHLWLSFNDRCYYKPNPDRACAHFIMIDTISPSPKIGYEFAVGSKDLDTFYPALSIDGSGNLGFVYAYSSSSDYASIAVSGLASNLQQGLDPGLNLAVGTTQSDTGGDRNRFGDYFGGATDPSDTSKIWVAGEYHHTANPADWSTHIGQLIRATTQSTNSPNTFFSHTISEQLIKPLITAVKNVPMNNEVKANFISQLKQLLIKIRDSPTTLCENLDSLSKIIKALEAGHFLSSERAASITARIANAETALHCSIHP
jgi:hypothetical protein